MSIFIVYICVSPYDIFHFTFWYTKKVKNNGCFGLSTGHVVDCESGAFIEPDLGAGLLTG